MLSLLTSTFFNVGSDAAVRVLLLRVLDKPLGSSNGTKVARNTTRQYLPDWYVWFSIYSSPLDLDTWAEILVPDFYDRICRLFGIPDSSQEEEDEAVAKMLHAERPSGLGAHIEYIWCAFCLWRFVWSWSSTYIQYVGVFQMTLNLHILV